MKTLVRFLKAIKENFNVSKYFKTFDLSKKVSICMLKIIVGLIA